MSEGAGDPGAALGYHFRDETLLAMALTHRSAGSHNNERLEFLGDSVLSLVITEALFHRCPELPEGDLSRLRASLVCGDSLAGIARSIGLGEYLRLGPGERKSGGYRRESILADAMEAVLGAVYLDGGHEAAIGVVHHLFRSRLDDMPEVSQLKDPKTRLQEWLQGRGQALPEYTLEDVQGSDHQQTFRVACRIDTAGYWMGEGGTRRRAEQAAASEALKELAPDV